MAVYDVGDPWVQTFYVRDVNGALADAGAFACTLTLPDASTPTVTIAHGPTGTYVCSIATLTQQGRHVVYAQATGANACAQDDQFDVRASASYALLSLADAKATLNIPSTDFSQDEEIRDYIDTTTDLIEQRTGYWLPRTVTETIHGLGSIALAHLPVMSVTSLTGQQTGAWAIDPSDIDLDGTTGILRRVSRDTFYYDYYTIVYVAGRTTLIPPRVIHGARVLLAHLWSTQRGSSGLPSLGDDDAATYAIAQQTTRRLVESLFDDQKASAIA